MQNILVWHKYPDLFLTYLIQNLTVCLVLCWSGLSDVCQNQIDILISLSWLGGPSFHFFLSFLVFCLFFWSLLCFLCSLGISSSQGAQKLSGSWDCGVEHKGQRKHLKNIYNPLQIQSAFLWFANHPKELGNQIIRFLFLTCHGSVQTPDP